MLELLSMIKCLLSTATDTGLLRTHNEDAIFQFQQGQVSLLIVADGMGGHQAGEVASALAIETMTAALLPKLQTPSASQLDLGQALQAAIIEANQAIIAYGDSHDDDANLGTTVTAVLVCDAEAVVANVGDSRTYLLRDQTLTQVTNDHSYVGELVRVGILKPEALFDHPRRSLITRSLGMRNTVEVDLFPLTLQTDDQLLLCSDGLWEMVRNSAEITTILSNTPTPAAATQQLINRANHYGGEDNIAVAIARFVV